MPDENETKLTTIQTDLETSRMLGLIAAAHERSKAAQLRVLVKREYDTLAGLKLLPTVDDDSARAGYRSIAE
ncbi:MAG TPA: hypothetical protein DCG54_07445 [Anaerolineae bacterium]|jgi:hypothetical protein|nr:hypothetical protein [Anaerolineae bacterium]